MFRTLLNTQPILLPQKDFWNLILPQLKKSNMDISKIEQIGGLYTQVWRLNSTELSDKIWKHNSSVWLEFDLDKIIYDRKPNPEETYFPEDSNLSIDAQFKVNLLQEIRTKNLFDFMCEDWMKYVKISTDSGHAEEWIKELAEDYHNNPLNVKTKPLRHAVMDRCEPYVYKEILNIESELHMFQIDELLRSA